MKRIVVTGGSGRLGREFVVPRLAEAHSVVVLDNVPPDDGELEWVNADITSIDSLTQAFSGADAIVHLAAVPVYTGEGQEERIWKVNVDGTFNVLEAARRAAVRDIVLASSVCAWGNIFWSSPQVPEYFPIDEHVSNRPDDMYGMSKLIGEVIAYGYARRYGQRIASLRLATVGLFDQDYWIDAVNNIDNPEFVIGEAAPGQPSAGAMAMTDFVYQYVDPRDVAQAFSLAIDALANDRVGDPDTRWDKFNIGAKDVFSSHPAKFLLEKYYPTAEVRDASRYEGESQAAFFDIGHARAVLGYEPQYTWRDFVARTPA